MSSPLCRFGILGTANIARKNWQAIRKSGNATLVAVASRDVTRSQTFIHECQSVVPFATVPDACGSYEALLARKDIDAVYIPLPTGIRKEWVIKAAEAGKHVLSEKPCGVTASDLEAMLTACQKHKVQFMDGVMFMHSRRLPLLRQVLDDGKSIGSVRRIVSQFSFKAPPEFLTQNIRVSSNLEPLGSLGDLGWYNIRLSLWVMKELLPERVTGRILAQHGRADSTAPVPTEFSGELFFPGEVTASFYCSFLAENQEWANVSGTQGHLAINDFVLPFFGSEVAFEVNAPAFRVTGCDFSMESHPRRYAAHEYSNSTPDSQETNMIRDFAAIVLSGKLDPSWGSQALSTQRVLDACLASAHNDGKPVQVSAG